VPNTYLVFARHRDGHPWRWSWWRRRCAGGRVRAVQGFARNVTERIRAEDALRDSEERYRTLFEESRDAVYMSTIDGGMLSANQALLEMFGWTRAPSCRRCGWTTCTTTRRTGSASATRSSAPATCATTRCG
jgi:PAS domain-containing protein